MPQPLIGFGLSRTAVLSHHLQYNHYPPIDPRWVPICERAIDIAIDAAFASDEGMSIDPSVLRVEVGQGKTAGEVLDGLHLWDFVTVAVSESMDDLAGDPEFKAGE